MHLDGTLDSSTTCAFSKVLITRRKWSLRNSCGWPRRCWCSRRDRPRSSNKTWRLFPFNIHPKKKKTQKKINQKKCLFFSISSISSSLSASVVLHAWCWLVYHTTRQPWCNSWWTSHTVRQEIFLSELLHDVCLTKTQIQMDFPGMDCFKLGLTNLLAGCAWINVSPYFVELFPFPWCFINIFMIISL